MQVVKLENMNFEVLGTVWGLVKRKNKATEIFSDLGMRFLSLVIRIYFK